jgi:RNA polymerase sigma factor FliA
VISQYLPQYPPLNTTPVAETERVDMVAERSPSVEQDPGILTLVEAEPEEIEVSETPTEIDTLVGLTGINTMDRDALIAHHLPLVRYVAGSMVRHSNASTIVDYDDLVGYGAEGLIDAVDSFNPIYNVRFSTWAVMHIRTTIQDALRTLDPLPRSLRSKSKEIEQVQFELANARGRWPSDDELADSLGISVEKLCRLRQIINRSEVSLEKATEGSGEEPGSNWLGSLADTDPEMDPEARLDNYGTRQLLREALGAIPERERCLLLLYYERNESMRKISNRMQVSESRVSQLHARALRLLRARMNSLLQV